MAMPGRTWWLRPGWDSRCSQGRSGCQRSLLVIGNVFFDHHHLNFAVIFDKP